MSLTLFGGRVSSTLIICLAITILALACAGGALAIGPSPVSGLASTTHPDEATWYGDATPSFTWSPMLGVEGFCYTLDQDPVAIPSTATVSLRALDFVDMQELTVGDPGDPPDVPYSSPAETAVADLDGDGDRDVVVADKGQSYVSVLLGDGAGGFATAVDYPTYPDDYPGWDGLSYLVLKPHSVSVGDIGSDGHPDIVVSNRADGTISVLHGNGDGTFDAPDWYAWGGGGAGDMRQVVADNMDNDVDGIDEIMAAAPLQHAVFVYRAHADGTLYSRDVLTVGGSPEALATGDFDRDGRLDIAVTDFAGGSVGILLGDAAADDGFADPVSYPVRSGPHSVVVSRFDDDEFVDLAVANWSGNSFSVLLGNGDGTFQDAINSDTIGALSVPSSVATADFNGDAVADLALTDLGLDTVFVFFGEGDGTFSVEPWFYEQTGDEPNHVSVADFDEDGLPDMVVSANGSTSSAVDLYLNRTMHPLGATFADRADGVWYFHVRAVDEYGNGGDTATRAVRIDTTPPVTDDDAPESFAPPSATVHLASEDAASGMTGGAAGTWYKLDDAQAFSEGTSVVVSGVGSHTLQYYSRDAAGNQESTKTVTLTGNPQTYTLTPSAGAHGSISPSTVQTIDEGDSQTFTITPDTGYHVADVKVDGMSVGAVTSYEFENVAAAHTIAATFAIDTFAITVTPGEHGSITPGSGSVDYGADATYAITPDAGYYVARLTVDGTPQTVKSSWTFTNVTAAHSIAATFAAKAKPSLSAPKSSKAAIRVKKSITLTGGVSVGAAGAPSVRIRVYRLRGTKWVTYTSISANVSGTKYTAKLKIAKTGKFRFKAYSSADGTHLAATSSMSKTVTVKK
jgi:hypothetical protein